jgi:hypothetical protein
MFEGERYALDRLPKKARHDVQKGLSLAKVEQIPLERLAEEGWALRLETLARQGRVGAETQVYWERLCLTAVGLPGFEAWGALIDGNLTSALLGFSDEHDFSILYQQSLTRYLPLGVNNFLAYHVTHEKVHQSMRIFYGLHSLDAPPSVDEFKFRMGYRAKAVRQRVVFHPRLAPLMNAFTHAGLRTTRRLLPGNVTLAKAEGMVRFYLQGLRPIQEQEWPEVLLSQKEAILSQASGL